MLAVIGYGVAAIAWHTRSAIAAGSGCADDLGDQELLAADAADDRRGTGVGAQYVSDRGQHPVARRVAEVVIEHFEPVQVDHRHDQVGVVFAGRGEQGPSRPVKSTSIQQGGQRIALGFEHVDPQELHQHVDYERHRQIHRGDHHREAGAEHQVMLGRPPEQPAQLVVAVATVRYQAMNRGV